MSNLSLFHQAGAVGKAVAITNVFFLVILPFVWFIPLINNSAFWILSDEVSIISGAYELYRSDLFLFFVVLIFAMIMPMLKCVVYILIWFTDGGRSLLLLQFGSLTAKLSMTDVFLLAILIIVVKGLSVATVTPLNGLYIFAAVVIISSLFSVYTDFQIKRFQHTTVGSD